MQDPDAGQIDGYRNGHHGTHDSHIDLSVVGQHVNPDGDAGAGGETGS